MIELDKEYEYRGICEALGWEAVEGGGKRQRQLKAVKSAYEWHHPINPKTGKPKRGRYVFTKQLDEIKYYDGRKDNGRKPLLSESDFELLLKHTVVKYGIDPIPIDDSTIKVLLFSSDIYKGFGFNAYSALSRSYENLREDQRNQLVYTVFRSCVVSRVHAYSIRRIASRSAKGSTSLEKEVVSKKDANSPYERSSIEASSSFQDAYETWENILTNGNRLPASGSIPSIASDLARDMALNESDVFDIRRANVLTIPHHLLLTDVDEDALMIAQKRFREIVLAAIQKQVNSLLNRDEWGDYIVDDRLRGMLSAYYEAFKKVVHK